jgi:hypothetical protein
MIYEIRTYNFQPSGAMAEWVKRFGAAYPTREKYSQLYGLFTTEIGPLNQVVHIWGYENLQQRADIRTAATKDPSGAWPPDGKGLMVSQESDILVPIPGMTNHKGPQQWGDLYELRMYTYPGGEIAKVAEAFSAQVAKREALYPVAGIWTSELGNLNRLYQLFPYKNWTHRDELRTEFRSKDIWPPRSEAAHPLTQLVRHLTPAPFSPLH